MRLALFSSALSDTHHPGGDIVLSAMDIVFWLVVLVISIPWISEVFATPVAYRYVPCTGRHWKRMFPQQDKHSIRTFLLCFTDGMAFSPADKLRFKPSDKVLDVYRSIYGGRTPLGDHMECETFLDSLSEEFVYDLDSLYGVWHEHITLGELFEAVINKPESRSVPL
ncbi:MAG: hypothetical protein AAF541_12190 [Pseudomonadota bacterium]